MKTSEDEETVDMQKPAEKRAEMTESVEQRIDLTVENKDSNVVNDDSAIPRNKERLRSRRRIPKVREKNYVTSLVFQI